MTDNGLEDKLRRVAAQRKVLDEQNSSQLHQEVSRRRLARILKKKITTSFIGALARFESFFGPDVWGHGKDEEECSPEQLMWREVWEQCRTEILNNGNNQLRAIENEIVQYGVMWNRHQATFHPKADSSQDRTET